LFDIKPKRQEIPEKLFRDMTLEERKEQNAVVSEKQAGRSLIWSAIALFGTFWYH
jgi:hypothetical protein